MNYSTLRFLLLIRFQKHNLFIMQILASELLRQRVDGIRTNRKLTCIGMKFTALNAIGDGKAQHYLLTLISDPFCYSSENTLFLCGW